MGILLYWLWDITNHGVSGATWRAFSKPWSTTLQGLVDEIDQTFMNIKDITHYHGLLQGHTNLAVGREILLNGRKTIDMHEESLARLKDLEHMVQEINATIVHFSKEQDVQQTANLLQQGVIEKLQEPERSYASKPTGSNNEGEPSGSSVWYTY